MQDDQLIADIGTTSYPDSILPKLNEHNITTYSQLFAVLRDASVDAALLAKVCYAVFSLSGKVDRRKAIPALLAALKSDSVEVRREIVRTLGMLRAKASVPVLMALADNRNEDEWVRTLAVTSLGDIGDQRAVPLIRRIMFDQSENLLVRTGAIEWTVSLMDGHLEDYIQLLSDPSADIRFWAAFALAQFSEDISPALAALDRLAAFDHAVPELWGWHVDREAFEALEKIYYQPYQQEEVYPGTYIISPKPEYMRFIKRYREWGQDDRYTTKPIPSTHFAWSSDELRERLQSAWPEIQFDARKPPAQTYLLDWLVKIDGFPLLGGLHRDGSTMILTGDMRAVYPFVEWVCSWVSQTGLFLYGWAEPGIQLKPEMDIKAIRKALQRQYSAFNKRNQEGKS